MHVEFWHYIDDERIGSLTLSFHDGAVPRRDELVHLPGPVGEEDPLWWRVVSVEWVWSARTSGLNKDTLTARVYLAAGPKRED